MVQPIREELGQGRLGAMDPEAPLEVAKFLAGEVGGIWPLTLHHQPRNRVDGRGDRRRRGGAPAVTAGHQKSQRKGREEDQPDGPQGPREQGPFRQDFVAQLNI